jgi:hypothetical protein
MDFTEALLAHLLKADPTILSFMIIHFILGGIVSGGYIAWTLFDHQYDDGEEPTPVAIMLLVFWPLIFACMAANMIYNMRIKHANWKHRNASEDHTGHKTG